MIGVADIALVVALVVLVGGGVLVVLALLIPAAGAVVFVLVALAVELGHSAARLARHPRKAGGPGRYSPLARTSEDVTESPDRVL